MSGRCNTVGQRPRARQSRNDGQRVTLLLVRVQNIIQAFRKAGLLAVAKARELSIDIATDDPAARRDMLVRCAMTSMNSKLVSSLRLCIFPRLGAASMGSNSMCTRGLFSPPEPSRLTFNLQPVRLIITAARQSASAAACSDSICGSGHTI